MATLAFDGVDGLVTFTPISSALANLPNGAGTIAALVRVGDQGDIGGILNSGSTVWYHVLGRAGNSKGADDDGQVTFSSVLSTLTTQSAGAGNYQIVVCDWPSGGAALERFHWSSLMSAAESWTHSDANINNGGNRAGPGTSGRLRIGSAASQGPLLGEIALLGIWAGVRLDDTGVEALWVNKKTSDWYNHSAGTPTCLIELTSTTPTDIGANPSTFSAATGGVGATGSDPTGWTFDGVGGVAPQELRPDADTATGSWASTPLWSKLNDESDASIVSETLA